MTDEQLIRADLENRETGMREGIHAVPQPNPTRDAILRMERVLTDALANLAYERRSALQREDREAHRIANAVQRELELVLANLRSEL